VVWVETSSVVPAAKAAVDPAKGLPGDVAMEGVVAAAVRFSSWGDLNGEACRPVIGSQTRGDSLIITIYGRGGLQAYGVKSSVKIELIRVETALKQR